MDLFSARSGDLVTLLSRFWGRPPTECHRPLTTASVDVALLEKHPTGFLLCVSVSLCLCVSLFLEKFDHRGTENTEKKLLKRLFGQSQLMSWCLCCALALSVLLQLRAGEQRANRRERELFSRLIQAKSHTHNSSSLRCTTTATLRPTWPHLCRVSCDTTAHSPLKVPLSRKDRVATVTSTSL